MEELKLQDAVVFLAAAGLVIPVVKWLRISPVLGFLVIGLAIGPYGLGRLADDFPWLSYVLITDVAGVRALAELGVVFLLFMIGLELSLERLWGMRRMVFGMGSTQILLTGIVIGTVAWSFGNSVQASVLLGSCLALSSTAIVIQLLIEQGRFGTTVGQGSFGVLLAQDIAVVPILFLAGIFGAQTGGSVTEELVLALGEAFLAVAVILGAGRFVVRPLFRFVGSLDSPELFMAVTLLLIVATAATTHAAGLSAALGSFLAGILLAESEYRHEVEVNIEPFKGLLLGLFFMSVAMGIDLRAFLIDPGWIALSIAGLLGIKAVLMTGVARGFGFNWGHSFEMGLLLCQGGEFAFVVVSLAVVSGVLPLTTGQFIFIVVGATMFLTPFIARLAQSAGAAIRTRTQGPVDSEIDLAPDLSGHVIIVGYGRTGQLLASILDRQQLVHVALDKDAGRVAELRAEGVPLVFGDASRAAMLEKVRFRHAAVMAVCTDDPGATEQVLQTASRVAPQIPVVARARDSVHGTTLLAHGASRVVPEVLEAGLQMAHVMLEQLGLPPGAARELVEAHRVEVEYALEASVRQKAGVRQDPP